VVHVRINVISITKRNARMEFKQRNVCKKKRLPRARKILRVLLCSLTCAQLDRSREEMINKNAHLEIFHKSFA